MADRIGVCAECGSKFKIPPTFKGTKAKCKKCGGEVQIPAVKQETPAPAPKAAGSKKAVKAEKPAPSAKRDKAGGKAVKKEGALKAPKSMGASARARGGGKRRPRGGKAKEGAEKSKNAMWIWIVGGVSVVAVVVICLIVFSGGDEEMQPPAESLTKVDTAAKPEVDETPPPPEEKIQKPVETEKPEETAEEVIQEPEPPKELDPVVAFELFGPIMGCPQERFDELTECFRDGFINEDLPVFKRKRLKDDFEEAMKEGFEVVPVLLNSFNGLNLLDRDDLVVAFKVAEYWNDFTGRGLTDCPVKGDSTEEAMQENLEWNLKAINSLVALWRSKVGDQEAQTSFFEKIETARKLEAERAAKEKE